MLHVFLPLKDPGAAKSRLAGLLSDEQRRDLVEAMALDVVDAVLANEPGTRLSIVAPSCWQGLLPRSPDLNLLREEQLARGGLNGVLREAIEIEKPERALVLHGDLPRLHAEDVRAAALALRDHEVVMCPDVAGAGTNALGFRSDAMPEFCFGPESFAAHRRCAEARSGRWTVLDRTGLASDIDTPADLTDLLRRMASGGQSGARTAHWAERHGQALLKSLDTQSAALSPVTSPLQNPSLTGLRAANGSAANPKPRSVSL